MPDRHDDVDVWLSERIEPLPPPPGTFDLIKRRARRRKYRKLAITAGSAAVIVAAAVTVPQVVNLPVLNPNPTAAPVAGAQSSVGTGWKLCERIRLGVEWSPVTIRTSGLRARSRETSASSASIISTLRAKLPSSPVLSVYL